jgi:hypothetical protein
MVGTLRFAHPTVLIQISKSLTVIASQRVARTLALNSLVVPAKPTGPAFGRPDDRLRASRDPYAVPYRFGCGGRNLLSQQTPVAMGPCFRRDDVGGFNFQRANFKRAFAISRRDTPELCLNLAPQ